MYSAEINTVFSVMSRPLSAYRMTVYRSMESKVSQFDEGAETGDCTAATADAQKVCPPGPEPFALEHMGAAGGAYAKADRAGLSA